MAFGDVTGSIGLYDISNLNHVRMTEGLGDNGQINGLIFHGQDIMAASVSGTVGSWATDPERVAAQICALAYPPITPTQWSQYLAFTEYQPPCP